MTGAKIQFLHKVEVGGAREGGGRERERWKDNLTDDTIKEKIAVCGSYMDTQTDCKKWAVKKLNAEEVR